MVTARRAASGVTPNERDSTKLPNGAKVAGMGPRTIFRAVASVFGFVGTAILSLNIETIATSLGLNNILANGDWRMAMTVLGPLAWLAIGAMTALWADYFLRRSEPSWKKQPGWSLNWKKDENVVAKLERVDGKFFIQCEVPLDGKQYINCKFERVTFVYNGGPVDFQHNEITLPVTWKTDSAATENVLVFIHSIMPGGMAGIGRIASHEGSSTTAAHQAKLENVFVPMPAQKKQD